MSTLSATRFASGGLLAAGVWLLAGLAVAQAAQPAPVQPGVSVGPAGLGRPATPDEIQRIDIDVRPDGAGLPVGSGTAGEGAAVFAARCAVCHGAAAEGTTAGPRLVDATPFQAGVNQPTIGNYWPYATTVWDYIHRAMPFDAPGSLSAEEVYAVTAYLLAQNGIIDQDLRLDALSLPNVKMPNQASFTSPDPRPDVP